MKGPTIADVTASLEDFYPPALAEPWDAVGLVCGDPQAPVRRVLFAVDPVAVVVEEALAGEFDLLVTHHPLWLRGTTSVAADTPKGRVVHRLLTAGCGLFVAHTNADAASRGVSDALGAAVGLQDGQPLQQQPGPALDKLVAFVPHRDSEGLIDALALAGAGSVGAYERCAWTSTGLGTFRPLPGAQPALGAVGETSRVEEARVEMVLPRGRRAEVLRALRAAHPYEEPAYDLLELATLPGRTGLGRIGSVRPVSLGELTERVASALPRTATGVRAAGDPHQVVRTLAVCGGSGGSLLAEAGAADAFLTADLRHHQALEAPAGLALLDAAHWATEWPWLADAAGRLRDATSLTTAVSHTCTDPWTTTARSTRA